MANSLREPPWWYETDPLSFCCLPRLMILLGRCFSGFSDLTPEESFGAGNADLSEELPHVP
jgi:hypothetical protein